MINGISEPITERFEAPARLTPISNSISVRSLHDSPGLSSGTGSPLTPLSDQPTPPTFSPAHPYDSKRAHEDGTEVTLSRKITRIATPQSLRIESSASALKFQRNCNDPIDNSHDSPTTLGYSTCHVCASADSFEAICCFAGIRELPYDGKELVVLPYKKGVHEPQFCSNTDVCPDLRFPATLGGFNEELTRDHIQTLKTAIAPSLAPVLETQIEHARDPEIVWRRVDYEFRSTCDSCNVTIFSGSKLCGQCGREYCLDCQKTALNHDAMTSLNPIQQDRIQRCNGTSKHSPQDQLSIGRHPLADLERILQALYDWMLRPSTSHTLDTTKLENLPSGPSANPQYHALLQIPLIDVDPRLAGFASAVAPAPAEEDLKEAHSYGRTLIALGEPFVVPTNPATCDTHIWSPAGLIEKYGSTECKIITNDVTQSEVVSSVGEFFSMYGKERPITKSVKIKDFPPNETFATECPQLFENYNQFVMLGSLVLLNGVFNLAAHAPMYNVTKPDLGPKGYFSTTANDAAGGAGSTCLHKDVCDAQNILVSAQSHLGTDEINVAEWHIFRREDSEKIRDFLYKIMAETELGENVSEEKIADHVELLQRTRNDPIYAQRFYLDFALRKRLFDETGVKSWQILQKPGDAVFIPAGCAHQVCNHADSIKIACDFVSLDNLERCKVVTEELRGANKETYLARTDVLMLTTQMLWAWQSCERFDGVGTCLVEESSV